jgi:hypothetical protein
MSRLVILGAGTAEACLDVCIRLLRERHAGRETSGRADVEERRRVE